MSFGELLRSKRRFLAAVYALLIAQVLISLAVMRSDAAGRIARDPSLLVSAMLTSLVLVLLLSFASMPLPVRLAAMAAVAGLIGVMLRRVADKLPEGAVRASMIGTTTLFGVMSLAGFALAATGVDVGPAGAYLFAALLGLLVAQVAVTLAGTRRSATRWIVTVVLVLFSLYTVYDTNQILQRNYDGDALRAAMDFYLDVLNLFGASMSSQS